MNATTLKLCLPVIALTAQQSVSGLIIPPFLQGLGFPVAMIGTLISVAPILAFAVRVPAGLVYRNRRARLLIGWSLIALMLCNFSYIVARHPALFALVHSVYGVSFSAVTTFYMAFFIESLPLEENRHQAMGFYTGALALGYTAGGFLGGLIADGFGYAATFKAAGILSLIGLGVLLCLAAPKPQVSESTEKRRQAPMKLRGFMAILSEPKVATIVVVALFLNLTHQIGSTFLPLYGLTAGLSLTQIGIIKGFYSLSNAVTRPVSGIVVQRIGLGWVQGTGLPLQCFAVMLVPLFQRVGPLLAVFLLVGFLRAVVLVSNTISLVQDVDESRVPRGISSGVYNASGDLGLILGPAAGGLIASFMGVAGLFIAAPALAVVLFLGALAALRFLPTRS